MNTITKKIIGLRAMYAPLRVYKLLLHKSSYLHATGWSRSLRERKPVDAAGKPLPWMNYAVIALLKDRLKKDMRVFEYGCGHSTLFYADRAESVTAVEYDEKWLARIKDIAPGNIRLIYQADDVDGAYCRSIHTTNEQYDVVIVDGRDRVNCVKQALDALTPNGVLLLDDAQREAYAEALRHAESRGFRPLALEGLKPTGTDLERTTLLYRPDNCFNI